MPNIGKLMKQAQEMQQKMAKIQDELAHREVEATSGGGMVTVKMNGQQELITITIDEEVFKDGDKEMLEDLVVAAVNEARRQALDMAKEEMSKLTGGLPIPGLF
ncbi:MAG: YbaB/EbfC family nucleoid-associated protein [Candidatus Latescibacterota bacterium]|nr:MAG: YbaB/EbfC family nucleoid-associated protein [Candidatus Latescibacterota bacterium]